MQEQIVQKMRRELEEKLPDLALQIFDIKSKARNGSYSTLVKGLGHLLFNIHDYEQRYTITRMMVDHALFKALQSEVNRFR